MFKRKGEALNKTDVINAAIYCLELEGENALGINRVAKELNIKPPSVYNHIKNNEELFKLVVIEGWRRLLNECEKNFDKNNDLEKNVRNIMFSFRSFASKNKSLYLVMSKIPIELDNSDFNKIFNGFINIFLELIKGFDPKSSNSIYLIRFLRSAVHGFILLELQNQFEINVSIDDTFEFIVSSFIKLIKDQK